MRTFKRGQITEIARETGSAVSTISEIFSGKKRPSPELAERLEKVTGVPRENWIWPQYKNNRNLRKVK